MEKNNLLLGTKIGLACILVASVVSFFYFEASWILRTIVALLAISSIAWAYSNKSEKPALSNQREIFVLLILYLGLFTFYNLIYGIGIPLYLSMLGVWVLVCIAFYGGLILDRMDIILSPALRWAFVTMIGLIILEVFLSLAFWPIDPQFKSLILIVVFYLVTNLVYLYGHNLLRLKRVIGFLIVGIFILGLLALKLWLSFKGQ